MTTSTWLAIGRMAMRAVVKFQQGGDLRIDEQNDVAAIAAALFALASASKSERACRWNEGPADYQCGGAR